MFRHRLGHQFEITVDELDQPARCEALGNSGEIGKIGKEDRHDLLFAIDQFHIRVADQSGHHPRIDILAEFFLDLLGFPQFLDHLVEAADQVADLITRSGLDFA